MARTSLGIQKSISRIDERERFPENGDRGSGGLFRLRIPFTATPHGQEECITGAKALRLSNVAEPIDLKWYGETTEGF
jgi:hypothetical protein